MLFIFYLVFGFLPLVAISFMTMIAKNQTIEEITKEQMQVSLSQIGLRMDMFYADARDDLSGFAKLIEVPCSITEETLDYKTRLELMILNFISKHPQFEIVAVCDPNSNVVAVADRKTPFNQTSSMDKDVLVSDFDRERIIKKFKPTFQTSQVLAGSLLQELMMRLFSILFTNNYTAI